MIFDNRTYSTLFVCASDKFASSFLSFIPETYLDPMVRADSISQARRAFAERSFDLVIINSPLPDEYGKRFAEDVSESKNSVALMIVKQEESEEIQMEVKDFGVYVLPKPCSTSAISLALSFLSASRERLRMLEKKSTSLESRMEEIRLINRAKWVLIDNENMTEEEAHKYIEKQAMDRSMKKTAVAKEIIEKEHL